VGIISDQDGDRLPSSVVRQPKRRHELSAAQPHKSDSPVVTVFHNPSCSKSRCALGILQSEAIEHDVVEYLVDPLSREDLEMIVSKLVDPVDELVRTGDKGFTDLGVDPQDVRSTSDVIEFLLVHPELMQRPIVVRGERAVIARPSERVAEVLG
jgi:arsenate reductase